MAPSVELRDLFARLSGLLFTEETVRSALDVAVGLAHDVLPGTAGAGVTLIRAGKKLTAAYSDEVVKLADDLQYDLNEGPCLSAWAEAKPFRIELMEQEDRWPRWTTAAFELGMRSSVSVPLVAHGRKLGAVKAYSTEPAAYSEGHAAILQRFADQAAIVLGNVVAAEDAERMNAQLKDALASRHLIAEALGILMERNRVGEEEAFSSLRRTAAEQGVDVRSTAERLVRETASGGNRESDSSPG